MRSLVDAIRDLGPRVRELAQEIEDGRRLPPDLAAELGRAGLWRSCVPRALGGDEVPFAELLGAIEELARADGSAGWCGMIGATSGLAYAFLDATVAGELFAADPDACTGGVIAPSGRAVLTDDGVRVSGRWSFASGVQHCSRVGLGVVVMDGDAPRTLDDGAPDIRTVLVDADDVEIIDTWNVSGLQGTGSHDIAITEIVIPVERSYDFRAVSPHEGPMYALPFFGLLSASVASVSLGISRSAIEELIELAATKTATGHRRRLAERSWVQMQIAEAEAELRAARAFLSEAVADAWRRAEKHGASTIRERAVLRLAATHAVRASARVVDRMYEAGGSTSIYASSRLQRHFRDAHTVTQHMVVAPATLELAGRVLLGVETHVGQL